ncbi:MAG: hypothetical protein AAGB32_01820 [Pseudomonadota bacterium]
MKLCRIINSLLVFSFVFFYMGQNGASAQDALEIRINDLDGYTRVVFDWPSKPGFAAQKNGTALSVTFDQAASYETGSLNANQYHNVGNISFASAADSSTASLRIAEKATYRSFSIGNRVIIDVYDSDETPERTVVTPSETPTITPAPSEESLEASEETETSTEVAPPPQEEELQTLGGIQPHVVTISSTEALGMAAFERADFLWLVFDTPELKIEPVLSGPNKDDFPAFEKFELVGATAYRMPKPKGYYFYGEGGGILWRLVITPTPRETKPLNIQVTDDSNLLWPSSSVAKVVELEDPLVGDVIQVVTVLGSSDFSSQSREYVELEAFPSYVGLAFAPRADDIQTSKFEQGLLIQKPNGLAVSPSKDTASILLQSDIEKETAAFEAEDFPDNIKRFYDFDRWQMGGMRALDKNRQILMNGIGSKTGAGKAEDLLTLAKLNIANDRGQEALGLLRVAALELPGIEESPSFIALRGAANALVGRDAEALRDFVTPSLKEYDEINYWKAFALAGLEDWQQSDAAVPRDVRPIEGYPQQIKEPVVLALAETALRAGKTQRAENLLLMLESEFPTMSFGRQSAWKYLNGELERQKGNFDVAMDNWTPLLTGEDDYYRAKAGLSVTRMQLERQKITPEKAIDRLESLRYAWRGDELESLVNFRLGEVYIDNDEYLKGLSVLRNAVSISPNAGITEEITNYMTSTFRRIFTDGELDDVPPIEAVSIYEEFKELTPIGKEGDLFVQNLAERLVEMDLLGRAGALLDDQVTHRLQGDDKAKVAIRLAAIRLLNNQPDAAMSSLTSAEEAMRSTGVVDMSKVREIKLLRARALSKLNRATEALRILSIMADDKDVIRLRADIAWGAGQWGVAATAFQKLIDLENIDPVQPPEAYEANLILNRAIALNLAGNRSALDGLRNRFETAMQQSDRARIFELVTRPRSLGLLENRNSVASLISEVDLFGEFLENYRNIN